MKYEFSYNGKTIAYEIIYKKVKNINIRVKPSLVMNQLIIKLLS
mgnify:CR=1 FL=1